MVVTLDGLDAEIAYPMLAVVVRRLSDHVRKTRCDAEDWPDKARGVIEAMNQKGFTDLINDLVQLREQYPQVHEQARLVTGMGWRPSQQTASGDQAETCLEVIELLVHRRQERGRRTGTAHHPAHDGQPPTE